MLRARRTSPLRRRARYLLPLASTGRTLEMSMSCAGPSATQLTKMRLRPLPLMPALRAPTRWRLTFEPVRWSVDDSGARPVESFGHRRFLPQRA